MVFVIYSLIILKYSGNILKVCFSFYYTSIRFLCLQKVIILTSIYILAIIPASTKIVSPDTNFILFCCNRVEGVTRQNVCYFSFYLQWHWSHMFKYTKKNVGTILWIIIIILGQTKTKANMHLYRYNLKTFIFWNNRVYRIHL